MPGHLRTPEVGVALGDKGLQQFGLHAAGGELLAAENAGRLLKDEVVVAGVIGLGIEAECPVDALEADLDILGGLDGEAGIADVEGLGGVVRALGEQLERARRALDALQVQARHQVRRQVLDDAEADALRQKCEVRGRSLRIVRRRQEVRRKRHRGAGDVVPLDAARQLRSQRRRVLHLVEEISGGGPGAGGKEESLARRVELAVADLRADEAGQGADRRKHRHRFDLDLALALPVLEGRRDLVEAEVSEPDLVVLVVGVAGPIAHRRDGGGVRTILALAGDLRLLQADVGLGRRRLEAGDVIVAGETGDRDAGIAAVEQVRAADGGALAVERRVRLSPVHHRCRVGRKQIGIARNAVIVGAAAEDVGVDRRIARAGVEQQTGFPAIVDRGPGCPQLGCDAARRRSGGNAIVDRFDDAADRLRAEAQRRRAAEDLRPLDRQGIDRHAVVLAEIGDVGGADAVLLDAHPEIGKAAQDRPRRARRETG